MIIVLNGILGIIQEFKAENAIEVLKKMLHPTSTVLRNSKQEIIDATLLVPGDIVLLTTGNKVTTDLRILESFNLKLDRMSLS